VGRVIHQAENDSLEKTDALTVMELPPGVRALGLKWVFKVKENEDGSVERFKARCTILGNLQVEGIDYDETFSPVVRYKTVRAILAIAAAKGYILHNMDVDTAFLYGSMAEEQDVFIQVPQGYKVPAELANSGKKLCAKVNVGIYGLKQAPRLWNKTIHTFMVSKGFSRTDSDPCLYTKSVDGEEILVAIFVDDLIIAGSNLDIIQEFKDDISKRFNMKDLGELTFILGMSVRRDWEAGTIHLFQSKYIVDVLSRFGMETCTSRSLPMDPGCKLTKAMSPKTAEEWEEAEQYPYREVAGSLMYLMVSTRPDIAFAVSCLSKYMNCHGKGHHTAADHLLRYLKGTVDIGLTYGVSKDLVPLGFCDADWGSDVDTRRSTTGFIFYMAGGPVCWKCKSQPTVALSSSESEYMALAMAAQEAVHLILLSSELGVSSDKPLLIWEDNTGAIAIAGNPISHERTKHIDLRHHFI